MLRLETAHVSRTKRAHVRYGEAWRGRDCGRDRGRNDAESVGGEALSKNWTGQMHKKCPVVAGPKANRPHSLSSCLLLQLVLA